MMSFQFFFYLWIYCFSGVADLSKQTCRIALNLLSPCELTIVQLKEIKKHNLN